MKRSTASFHGNGNAAQRSMSNGISETSKQKEKHIVVDTSVLVHDPNCLIILPKEEGGRISIPWVVMEELDAIKTKPDIGWDAREVSNLIELDQKNGKSFVIEPRPTKKFLKGLKDGGKSTLKADYEIIATALSLNSDSNKEVILYSRDTILRVLAREKNLTAEDYPYGKVEAAFDPKLKRINVPEEIHLNKDEFYFECNETENLILNEGVVCLSKNPSGEWGEIFCALFKGDNRFIKVKSDISLAGVKPFVLENGEEECKNGNDRGLKTNWNQMVAMQQLLDPQINAVFLQGGAGTGKTVLALAAALEQKKSYTNIVIARPMVHLEDRDEIGFLPGGLDEKMAPWVEPIQQAFTFICEVNPDMRDQITKMRENKKIIIKPLDYIRGETYHKSFMVIDEAQNLTPHQIKTIITRAGQKTKMVFTGDLGQIDRGRRLDRKSSGLAYTMVRMANLKNIGSVNFNAGVRSLLANQAEELL